MPSAISSAMAPVGITSIGARLSSPSRMIEPRPNCRSIWASAVSRALSLSPPVLLTILSLPAMETPVRVQGCLLVSCRSRRYAAPPTVPPHRARWHRHRAGPEHGHAALAVQPRRGWASAAQTPTLGEQLFDHEPNTPDPAGILPRAAQGWPRAGPGLAHGWLSAVTAVRRTPRRPPARRSWRPPRRPAPGPPSARPARPGLVLGDAARIGVAELCPHPLPELAEPHGPPLVYTVPAGEAYRGPRPAAGRQPRSESGAKSEVCDQPGGEGS